MYMQIVVCIHYYTGNFAGFEEHACVTVMVKGNTRQADALGYFTSRACMSMADLQKRGCRRRTGQRRATQNNRSETTGIALLLDSQEVVIQCDNFAEDAHHCEAD